MGSIFNLDSPFMRVLNRIADLMILNVVALFFVLVPFTGGASLTAMHYVLLKMVRDEDTYVVRGFWKSFKQNFKQSTILWIIMLVIAAILGVDYLFIYNNTGVIPGGYFYVLFGLTIVLFMFVQYVFPLQSKFINPIKNTLKNSVIFAILGLPRTIGMVLVSLVIPALLYFVGLQILPLVFLFGLTVPAYIKALLYSPLFKRFEPEEEPLEDNPVSDEDDEELQAAIRRMQEARDKK